LVLTTSCSPSRAHRRFVLTSPISKRGFSNPDDLSFSRASSRQSASRLGGTVHDSKGIFFASATVVAPGEHNNEGTTMSSTGDKASGKLNQAVGKAKEGIGKAVGSEDLQAEGAAQQVKGHAQEAVGKGKDVVKDVANKAADKINKAL